MIMEPHLTGWIEELRKNNNSPSDEAVQEVKEFLVKPVEDLMDLDAEILDLKNRLSELESRRGETQKLISQYRSILAPIRRIPPDVLGEIFLHSLPTNRNPIMTSTECPLLLGRVCSLWRTVAMSSPRLWERICVIFTDADTLPDLEHAAELVQDGKLHIHSGWQSAQSKSEKQCTTDSLRRRYEAVKEWLLRSGTRPLSISLSLPSTFWYNVSYSERPPSVMVDLLSFLATLAPRMKDLELKTSSEIYEVLEQMLNVSEMTALTSLRMEYHSHLYGGNVALVPMIFHAPHLKNLSISCHNSTLWATNPPIRWNQLTNISCVEALTSAQTFSLLRCTSNLVHYKGAVFDFGEEDITFPSEDYLSLPFLRSLSLTQRSTSGRPGNIHSRIDAPSLQCIDYYMEVIEEAVIPILPLLLKSTELQKLCFDTSQCTAADMFALLHAVPSITHLVIGYRIAKFRPLRNFSAPSPIGYTQAGNPDRDMWGFGNLIVPDDLKDEKNPLLPKLTSLVISSLNAPISDETLLDLIKSRMLPGRTVALEHVEVMFFRQMEKDIKGELSDYADQVGSKIKLDLDYPSPAPTYTTDTISPYLGLDESGRSWQYTDAGEGL